MSEKIKAVLFDLDGTLTDPGIGITNSVMYSLKHWGIEVEDRSQLYGFIGPPLLHSFAQFYGFSPEKAAEALVYYREYYREKGIYENDLYPGVPQMLADLKAAGYRVLLATSKPNQFARIILDYFDLTKYFDDIAAASMDESRNTKDQVLAYAMTLLPDVERNEMVMVGDRYFDTQGAAKFGMPCIGVLYGYGSREELLETGAAALAESPEDVVRIIENHSF